MERGGLKRGNFDKEMETVTLCTPDYYFNIGGKIAHGWNEGWKLWRRAFPPNNFSRRQCIYESRSGLMMSRVYFWPMGSILWAPVMLIFLVSAEIILSRHAACYVTECPLPAFVTQTNIAEGRGSRGLRHCLWEKINITPKLPGSPWLGNLY